jgi:enamine deaminase RidA (YjgF/YER057c/UK114 family)
MTTIKITTTNPPTIHAPRPTYSHIASAPLPAGSTLVTFSGQIGKKPDGSTPPDFTSQVAAALGNLGHCLEAVGLGPESIMKVTQYIVGAENAADPGRGILYTKFMGEHRPASTLVGVAFLADPNLLYEIEAVAVLEAK